MHRAPCKLLLNRAFPGNRAYLLFIGSISRKQVFRGASGGMLDCLSMCFRHNQLSCLRFAKYQGSVQGCNVWSDIKEFGGDKNSLCSYTLQICHEE